MFKNRIGTEGCSNPVGMAGRLRPRRRAEEAQLLPHGKRADWSGNQRYEFYFD